MPMGTQAAKSNPEAKTLHSLAGKERAVGGVKLLLQKLGPGLITGASDDDPSGIGTYSQVGAQFGYGLLWTMLFSYPLMAPIQDIIAQIVRGPPLDFPTNLPNTYPNP